MENNRSEKFLPLGQAAQRLNVHPTTLRRWADNGDFPCVLTPGGHRRFALKEIERFVQQQGYPRRRDLEKAWADRALAVTRREIGAHRQDRWLTLQGEQDRERNRQLGRQLLALTLQYISNGEDPELLAQARRLGQQYGRQCREIGLTLTDALSAAIFFRDMMVESALQLPDGMVRQDANLRLVRRLNRLLNTVHLAIAQSYDDANEDPLSGV